MKDNGTLIDMDSRITEMLNIAWATDDGKKALSLARKVLEISPGNADALIIIADNTEDENERKTALRHALESLDGEDNYPNDDRRELSFSINYRLAYMYLAEGDFEPMLSACEEAMKTVDPDNEDYIKSLYYRALIGVGEWRKILELTMKDETHGLAWGYSRLAATWRISGNRALCAKMFWDALILSPDVPFYILGYYDEPDNDEDSGEFDFALIYSDVLNISEDFRQWFTRGTILFGLLTNRFDGREREFMLDVIDTLGGYEEYERMSNILLEADDESVIETLAANKCLSE